MHESPSRHARRSAMVAATAALLAATFGLGSGSPAAAAEPSIATPVKTVRVDVDGDGRKDTAELVPSGWRSILVRVVTARKQVAQIVLPFEDQTDQECDSSCLAGIWYGAAQIDGARGYELLLETSKLDIDGLDVLTWRSGALVREKAPTAPQGAFQKGWSFCSEGSVGQGMHFFTSGGRRYVDYGTWSGADGQDTYTAVVRRSIWRSGAWRSVKQFTRKRLSSKQVERYGWFSGARVILPHEAGI